MSEWQAAQMLQSLANIQLYMSMVVVPILVCMISCVVMCLVNMGIWFVGIVRK